MCERNITLIYVLVFYRISILESFNMKVTSNNTALEDFHERKWENAGRTIQ